jgi:hypothetical protein
MNLKLQSSSQNTFTALTVFGALVLFGLRIASAQPTIISSVPANFATGVSPSAAVVFTFSEQMDTANTSADFITPPFTMLTTMQTWSANDTVLTCTPTPAFPANTSIVWSVTGQNLAGMSLGGSPGGLFTTGTGSGGGAGSGTNAITTFSVGKIYFNQQSGTGAPTPQTDVAYGFFASTTLASNRTANTITVTLPSGAVSNLANFSKPEAYSAFGFDNNNSRFETTFAEGNYVFKVTAATSNQQVTVTLPLTMTQPNAPHILNFTNAQSVDVTKSFTFTWDPFQGGTTSDFISLSVSDSHGTVFQTPNIGTNGALTGTATSATIPANTLAANSTNTVDVIFYRFVPSTNATYATFAYRATDTELGLNTIGSAPAVPVVANPTWSGSNFSCDVTATPNQTLNVLYSTDCSQPLAQWQKLLTTNSPVSSFRLTITPPAGGVGFFRFQN